MKAGERNDLIVSWLTISIAFAIVLSPGFLDVGAFTSLFPISAIVVGTGFIFHELAHRQVAKHFGAHAEYRAWRAGLIFAIFSSFLGFIFAAPGAVYIYGNINRKQNGIISIAGPLTNIAIAVVFSLLIILNVNEWINLVGVLGFRINMFLALFNMLPIGPLDGSKVFVWSKLAWGLTIATSFIGVFLAPVLLAILF